MKYPCFLRGRAVNQVLAPEVKSARRAYDRRTGGAVVLVLAYRYVLVIAVAFHERGREASS